MKMFVVFTKFMEWMKRHFMTGSDSFLNFVFFLQAFLRGCGVMVVCV